MEIRANPPSPPVSDAGNKTQGIHKVKQYNTANFSEVAALLAQDIYTYGNFDVRQQCNNFLKLYWIGSKKLHV